MRVSAQFTDPGNISATVSITATLKQWTDLGEALKDAPFHGPAGKLRSAIVDMQLKLGGRVDYEPSASEQEPTDG